MLDEIPHDTVKPAASPFIAFRKDARNIRLLLKEIPRPVGRPIV
jgi:hypothetical protein